MIQATPLIRVERSLNKFRHLIQLTWSLLDMNYFVIDIAFIVREFSVSKRKLATYLPESSYSVSHQ
jgi:hypothetical protein